MDFQALLQEKGWSGVRPLPVHVGAVYAEYIKNPALAPRLSADLAGMVRGIQAYQENPWRRGAEPLETAWQDGQASLLRRPAQGKKTGAVMLVPSMINKSAILDLLPGKSFARWLAAKGCDVYLLDWGDPVEDKGMATMEGVTGRLTDALGFLLEYEGKPFHAMGYCMGGTLLAAAAVGMPEALRSAVFLASPWDFHAGDMILTRHVQMATSSALQMIDADGKLPADWIQSIFAVISAERTAEKFSSFAALDPDSEQAQLFVAVEDWLNDGIDFPGAVARTCIVDWYGENRPGNGKWIDLSQIGAPALVVASSSDRLVPLESSMAMAGALPGSKSLKPAIGHIGMMTAGRAEKEVWEPVLSWISGT